MPETVYTIPTFIASVKRLLKRPKDNYKSCIADFCRVLKNKSYDEVFQSHYFVKDYDHLRLIKLKIKDSHQSRGASDGYRVIVLCDRKNKSITLLNIYPKRGKQHKLDQTNPEYKSQLQEYIQCVKSGTLQKHSLSDFKYR